MEVTLNLSETTFQYISELAKKSKTSFGKVIENAFERKYEQEVESLKESVKYCSDEEVLTLANLMMPEKESNQLSRLLAKNKEANITKRERNSLDKLMQLNRLYDLRKALGIVEALNRKLIKSVDELS
jgi:predicted CopG family antitoxin